jgi:tripartite-type tricarboxylate transporter receptor subunit TctC
MRKSILWGAALATVLSGAPLATDGARAAWPEKPIRVVVPFAAGGTSDQMARIFARAVDENKLLPQPINVFNVTGHYSVGSRQVKDAPADGYNFLVIHVALMGGQAAGLYDFGYKDFTGVATTGEFCVTPVVRTDSPWTSLKDLLAAAKEKPDTLTFGVNIAAINHMAGLMIQETTPGARFRWVQVGGGAENFKSLSGGHTQVGVLSDAEFVNFRGSGAIRPLGYTGSQRNPGLPDLPTLKELGYDVNFCVANWWFAPKATPAAAVDAFAAALEKAQKTEYIQKQYAERLFVPVFRRGAAMQKELDDTWKRIEPIGKMAAATKK